MRVFLLAGPASTTLSPGTERSRPGSFYVLSRSESSGRVDNGRKAVSRRIADDAEQVHGRAAGGVGSAGAERLGGQGATATADQLQSQSLLLLSVLLLPAQLLADARSALAGTARRTVHETAGVHGLSGLS